MSTHQISRGWRYDRLSTSGKDRLNPRARKLKASTEGCDSRWEFSALLYVALDTEGKTAKLRAATTRSTGSKKGGRKEDERERCEDGRTAAVKERISCAFFCHLWLPSPHSFLDIFSRAFGSHVVVCWVYRDAAVLVPAVVSVTALV